MKKLFFALLAVSSSALFTTNAQASTTGPKIDNLYPTSFYLRGGDGLYVEFQAGSMPGCSHGRGGRLEKSNFNYDQLYALMLTMMTTKSFSGRVIFNETSHNGWWKCSISGIEAFPQ
ncbi:hypothetical protein [Pseudoalteromonas obscura]|uniref:Uncharacterized protein n=1 Tax=Pseudoalteromonas obscura TaxID=3048491 RepID=A0ABT7EH00_9GAMM|nr:hypothetical protein [Pseudoalteromonas sp. P94(2023)]MDK2594329.1 hypothetical protein [Pseudoalteromonas sp. P94(2023)]